MLKKVLILSAFFFIGFVYANDGNDNVKETNPKAKVELREEVKPNDINLVVDKKLDFFENAEKSMCRVSCSMSVTMYGITTTFEASAGNFLTSCESASRRCQRKLMHQLVDMLF
ncbi:MAG: hypothetical protein GKR88_04655 [Flavobacteriaceae bacterium]|nr:MAG: hypothetical protein GKR88_04655 [Flavobacteriaceae bacterium]